MAEKALADMLELIKCPVCWQGPRDAHQCPKCSKAFCHVCITAALHQNSKCPFCRYDLKPEELVRCPWLDDVCSMAEKAGESLRKCAVHNDQLMTHFDTVNRKPACEHCVDSKKRKTICSIEEAKKQKKRDIVKEIKKLESETKLYWDNQVVMKKNFEMFSQFGDSLCTDLARVLTDQTSMLEEHMNAVRNALNEIRVLIPKKLQEEVNEAAKNRVYEFLTDEWCSEKGNNNDATFLLEIEDIRQLELETSPRHSKTIRVGDRNWYVDVGLLNIHKVGGWEPDDQEHLSVIIWQEEATRGTMPPPMSALIVAKNSNADLVEVVLFEKFNDLRGFGRRLFLSLDQLIQCGTTRLDIEVVLGRQSPSFSLRLLRRMMTIAKEADERMRSLNALNKRLYEKTRVRVQEAINEILQETYPNTLHQYTPSLQLLDIDEMVLYTPYT
jgi:hypothetical protein